MCLREGSRTLISFTFLYTPIFCYLYATIGQRAAYLDSTIFLSLNQQISQNVELLFLICYTITWRYSAI